MLSFGKILLLVLVAVIAVIGFRLVGVIGRSAGAAQRPPRAVRREQKQPASRTADLTACPVCGAYSDGRCDRPDCGLGR
jgi:hypothetical protein